jgi:predicted branched-subunit amino acid permease
MTGTGIAAGTATRRGALEGLTLLAAYVPFALVIGSAAADHGGAFAGWAGSWLIFAGSAHLAAIRTLDAGGPFAAILTGLLINARLVVYSASLAPRWSHQPRWFRVVGAALIVDPTWAIAEHHDELVPDPQEQRRYFLGAGATMLAGWSAAIAVGAVMGARLESLDLRIVIPLCLLGLIGTGLRDTGTRLVIVTAAAVALFTANWPSGTGILAAVLAAMVVSLVTDGDGV